jgi:hypothetical protein
MIAFRGSGKMSALVIGLHPVYLRGHVAGMKQDVGLLLVRSRRLA